MSNALAFNYNIEEIIKNLVTENNEPVDNTFSAKQQRLLVEPLYSSWSPLDYETGEPRKFWADADVLVSLNVELREDVALKDQRAYFVWETDKVPDVCTEIVSKTKGGETTKKKNRYAEIGVPIYVVFDPFRALSDEALCAFQLGFGKQYITRQSLIFDEIGLGVTLWKGDFEDRNDEWLRWTNADGDLILTGNERAKLESKRGDAEKNRADIESERANLEYERAEMLAEKLRDLGIDI
ncbi:MAG: Uma2 family endonuclease [Pyrinomonadaceae bacterium]|nr:Uma2 family endonuclease [Pyrinomonadaceae bacterium]